MMLARDPAVPQRDALLSGDVMRRLFPRARTCERVYAKYRVGESLRVVYRLDGEYHVAARTFRGDRGQAAYERARATAVPAGPLPPVLHLPQLDTVFWAFPNDRKLAGLPLLTLGSQRLAALLGRPSAALRIVAYAAEQSASARCLDASGRAVAYVKVHAGADAAEHERRQHEAAGALVPRLIAASAGDRALAVEPVPGRRLDALRGADLARGLHGLGTALARLHATRPVPGRPFTRIQPDRLAGAAATIARARPDAAPAAARALAALLERSDEAAGPAVRLHGDANLRNAIAGDRGVVLLDLEQSAAGPAAADLGQLLAGFAAARLLGRLSAAEERSLAAALLDGYGPPPAALRWHTCAALLARVAQPAVNRVRPDLLQRLVALLEAAAP